MKSLLLITTLAFALSAPPDSDGRIEAVELGSQLGADGTIADGDEATTFAAGEPIILVVHLDEAETSAGITVVWKGPQDEQLDSQTTTLDSDADHASFNAPSTHAWQEGKYTVEVTLDDEHVAQVFTISGKAEPQPAASGKGG